MLGADLFPSFFDDWVDPSSIVGLIVGMHADVGDLIHHDRTPRELRDALIFFFKWVYVPPAGTRLYGSLERIPLPPFNSPSWPLPDMSTSEAFRAKMRKDFQLALQLATGSRRSHIKWFMPLTVFVDLFASATNRQRTPTLFTIRDIEDHVFNDLMDPAWHTKTVDTGDIIRCSVSLPSVVFRFHIGRQTLYSNFEFTRERYINNVWVLMEHEVGRCLVSLECHLLDENPHTSIRFNVGTDWPVLHLRHEVQIALGTAAPKEFNFWFKEVHNPIRKINRRKEKTMTVVAVLLPVILKMKSIA